MLIELWRKVVATDYAHNCCAICGNDFDRGAVYPVAFSDHGDDPRGLALAPVGGYGQSIVHNLAEESGRKEGTLYGRRPSVRGKGLRCCVERS